MKNNSFLTLNKQTLVVFLIFFVGTILRFYNLDWDLGQYLHPDERLYINAANLSLPNSFMEFFSPASPLNPHMFYYGSFPLYLYKIVASLFLPSLDLLLVSRLISAFFSSLTIVILFLATKQFFSVKIATLASLIFAFTPGSIQYAHFNTTESLLIFLLTTLLYLSSKFYNEKNLYYGILLGIGVGLAFATKIVGLTFAIFPLITYTLLFFQQKRDRVSLLASFLFFLLCAAIVGFLMSPYQLIDFSSFVKEQSYMQAVTYGRYKPPFVIIYEGSLPYLYPLLHVLPYTFGVISLICSILGLFMIKKYKSQTALLLLLSVFPLLYFLWAGAWYAKFSRYYLLLVPFLSIYAALFISRLRTYLSSILLFFIIIQGLLFFQIYLHPNTRIAATNWIHQNIPSTAVIATEHWDDPLPLFLATQIQDKAYQNETLAVYDADTNAKIQLLSQSISKSDYLILSSRRVYDSILHNVNTYPYTSTFYNKLFSNQLGFTKVKEFTQYPYGFSDDYADESFQSYDHPPVMIYKNISHKTEREIFNLLSK